MNLKPMISPREAAYIALLDAVRGERTIRDSLNVWWKNAHCDLQDKRLAQELAYGTMRRKLSLEYYAKKLSGRGELLKLDEKEEIVLHLALYQNYFMDRIPLYAITNEMVELAKTTCHGAFAGFLNAILRNCTRMNVSLPGGNDASSLSTRFSYPEIFVQALIKNYKLKEAKRIMTLGNERGWGMVRVRHDEGREGVKEFPRVMEDPFLVVKVDQGKELHAIFDSEHYYIQNVSPLRLLLHLQKQAEVSYDRVLDMCSSPGGKLLALMDMHPEGTYHANDVSEQKLKRLEQNLKKYGLSPRITMEKGEKMRFEEPYSLIVLDVPCSNSGVLNKRPEARWRITPFHLRQLERLQLSLIENALRGLREGGMLWYMTCSILNKENGELVKKACKEFNLQVVGEPVLLLPSEEGEDGGYACALQKVS